ncbi:MAG: hypothetical protein KKA32_12065 [Actinobacteria bacterium]|nr:hypothetical protein [Actinomycetota bacterium]
MKPAHDNHAKSSTGARVDDYLARLEEALELLGPTEAADTRAELGSYLAEAARDGRVDEVLGTMGAPESFAAGILSERGMLATPGPLPSPSGARIAVAAIVDVIVAIAPLALGLPLAFLMPAQSMYAGATALNWIGLVIAIGILVITVGIWPWYYWRSRNRPGRNQSVGRNVAGLRTVRAGGEVRVVRASDMPRGRRGMTRAGAVIRFLVAFWIVGGVAYAMVYSYAQDRQSPPDLVLQVVAQDVGSAVGVTTQLTAAVMEAVSAGRATTEAPPDLLEDAAVETYLELLGSAIDNSARTYEITWVSEATYVEPDSPLLSDATFLVEALERGGENQAWRFTVRKDTEVMDDGTSSVTSYQISHIQIGERWAP